MPSPNDHGPRVLIVDDDWSMRRCLCRHFEERGFTPLAAPDGEAALALAENHPPDAAVIDELMPGLCGRETLSRLRRLPGLAELPALIFTGNYDEELERDALHRGIDAYLYKFAHSPSVVPDHVARLLERRRDGVLRFGKLEVAPLSRTAAIDGTPLELPPKEAELLSTLARRSPAVVSWDEIRGECWPEFDGECWVKEPPLLSVTVSRLKQRLGAAGAAIGTVRGAGLQLRQPSRKQSE